MKQQRCAKKGRDAKLDIIPVTKGHARACIGSHPCVLIMNEGNVPHAVDDRHDKRLLRRGCSVTVLLIEWPDHPATPR